MNSEKTALTLQEWLSTCPTAWNAEYDEQHGRLCYFICDDGEDLNSFFDLFQ
jgi:hypothetical protein